ncbi:MAG: hypothetical protein FWG38_04140 [Defluviitaleaceae bacterium]|nr:hypothetical protein [Defluviitaleaceae bacterium]
MQKYLRKQLWKMWLPILTLHLTFFTAGGMYISDALYETIGIVAGLEQNTLFIAPFLSGEHVVVSLENARIYNLLTGFSVDAGYIEKGQSVRAAYDGAGRALAVWLNHDDANAAVFSITISDNIQYGADYCVFLCTDNKYRVTLSPQTVIIDPYGEQIFPGDVAPGQALFVWVDMITASSPSLVYPEKVVLMDD